MPRSSGNTAQPGTASERRYTTTRPASLAAIITRPPGDATGTSGCSFTGDVHGVVWMTQISSPTNGSTERQVRPSPAPTVLRPIPNSDGVERAAACGSFRCERLSGWGVLGAERRVNEVVGQVGGERGTA